MGTEYLVRPVGRAEDKEDACDFEPGEENGEEELGEEDDDDEGDAAGKGEVSAKRKGTNYINSIYYYIRGCDARREELQIKMVQLLQLC
ncbi:hypothetical protein Sjap_011817 [Stephania japonica]|uniref:Uncharacterized protein n=1 Tax=Stephania japonica TaxID=461633 RepID=A0AAP0JD24_9MAGN